MAENKKSFLLYCDLLQVVRKLPKETQADLFLHILEYVNDLSPTIKDNILLEVAFEPIKLQLKRDLVKYEGIKTKNAENARKRWDAKNAVASDGIIRNAKNADTDNDTVTDNGNDTDNDIGIVNKAPPKIEKIKEWFFSKRKVGDTKNESDTEAEKFFYHYEKMGWKINGQHIENYEAAVFSWISKQENFNNATNRANFGKENNGAGSKSERKLEALRKLV